ncbi:MAG TPA: DUF2478 domain-containing protein [Rhodoblastus sp.]|nr:DUF2478 domain-containing protein [Rhodoblastus sp.]
MSGPSVIAVIANDEVQDAQALLARIVANWRERGLRVAGVLAEDREEEGACSAGFLRDIGTGTRFSIQLDAAPAGASCHLDARGVEGACEALLPQVGDADIVVLSKFGKLEATGQGLWPAFASAASAGIPLLTTVSPRHVAAWNAWAPAAEWLEAGEGSVERWRRQAQSARPGH